MAKIDELIREEERTLADLEQQLQVAANERNYAKVDETTKAIGDHQEALHDLQALRVADPPDEPLLIGCATCGALIFPEGGPYCDTHRPDEKKPRDKGGE
jgi:hypothetical protein